MKCHWKILKAPDKPFMGDSLVLGCHQKKKRVTCFNCLPEKNPLLNPELKGENNPGMTGKQQSHRSPWR